jgi:hypothetical protein
MPMYDYQCQHCGNHEVAYRHISGRHEGPMCCENGMALVILPALVAPDLPGYESPVTGKWIEGRAARREDLKRSGCRPYEEGERQEYLRQKSHSEKVNDKKLFDALATTYYALPESKRRVLRNGY